MDEESREATVTVDAGDGRGAGGTARDGRRPMSRRCCKSPLCACGRWRHGSFPDGRPDALLRLGIRIARNLAISELRRSRTDPVEPEFLDRLLSEDEGLLQGPDRASDPILRQAIEECRRILPRKLAEAIQARIDSAGAEPDAVLAERVRMRRNTFLQNVTRARRLLADCLRRRGIDVAMELS